MAQKEINVFYAVDNIDNTKTTLFATEGKATKEQIREALMAVDDTFFADDEDAFEKEVEKVYNTGECSFRDWTCFFDTTTLYTEEPAEITFYTLFGKEAVDAYCESMVEHNERKWKEIVAKVAECDHIAVKRVVHSTEACNAYYDGLRDGNGWENYYSITKKDFEEIERIAKENK